MVEDRPRKIALIGATAYELEHRLVNPSQRCIHRYTIPPEDVAAGYVEAPPARYRRSYGEESWHTG